MIRKIFLFAALLLTVTAASAKAVGEWNFITQFSGNIDRILETPEKVYYTSGGRLFSYDKDGNETYAYTTNNKLSDTDIKFIKYNPDGKYLFIAYETGNIDLLYDSGRTVNLTDIKDATLSYDKGISSAVFANGRIYLATNFGIVIYDDKKLEVVESGIYGKAINAVFPVGDFLFVVADGTLRYLPLSAHHNIYDKFTLMDSINPTWVDVLGDNATFLYCDKASGKLGSYTLGSSSAMPQVKEKKTYEIYPVDIMTKTKNKNFVIGRYSLAEVGDDGTIISNVGLPSSIQTRKMATVEGVGSVWVAGPQGIALMACRANEVDILSDYFKPEGIVTDKVFHMRYDPRGSLWMGNTGVSEHIGGIKGDQDIPQALTRITGGVPYDMTYYDAKGVAIPRCCTQFDFHPDNPNVYFQGSNFGGLYVIEYDPQTNERKQLHLFTRNNSPFRGPSNWNSRVQSVNVDPDGNLWVGLISDRANGVSTFYMLPRATMNSKPFDQIVESDWQPSKHLGLDGNGGNKDQRALLCKHSPVMFTFDCTWMTPVGVTLTNGTWGNTKDDTYFRMEGLRDQDGKTWLPDRTTCMIEDQRGRVWIAGTNGGIIEIADPAKISPEGPFRANRIKVPRNDGTNYADYLCETDKILSMAVDNSNRKWIATEASGVYLVSENGDRIIEHFTADNSPLPTNEVLSVICDPNSNTVYFGMQAGLMSYNSTSSPAAEDYSEMYAYPNPVRPDYTGYITITGLMDNSLVIITDAAGNVVHRTRSEGGMAIWDGFDEGHNHVKTGVYYVYASEGPEGSSNAAVTKIMIIR